MTTKKELPLHASTLVADYLRPAASAAGVQTRKRNASGFTLRQPVNNWSVNRRR